MKKEKNSLGEAIFKHKAGELKAARSIYLKILEKSPDHSEALHLLGVIAFQSNELEKAQVLVKKAIALSSNVEMYFANLGRIEKARGKLREAEHAYTEAIKINATDYKNYSDLAAVLIELEDYGKAEKVARAALKISSKNPYVLLNLGLAQLGLGLTESAISSFQLASEKGPYLAEAHFQYGRMLQNNGHLNLAKKIYEKAIKVEPDMIEAHCNLGNVLRMKGLFEKAINCFDRALTIKPESGEIFANKGVVLHEMGHREKAIKCYRKGLRLNPNNSEAHKNLSMALLQGKEFEEGWIEFEWRLKTENFKGIRQKLNASQWRGENVKGKKICVHAEQGLGDSIQFCRYLTKLAERGAKVIVECPTSLVDLLGRVSGVSKAVVIGTKKSDFDFHIPMMSLPGVFDENLKSPSIGAAYIFVPKEKGTKWAKRVPKIQAGLNIGIVWKGNINHPRDSWRSLSLEVMSPLLTLRDVNIFSLQKDAGSFEIQSAGLVEQIDDLSSELGTFSDTAAAISVMDLVISVDTAVAHLSGAMGKEVWILLPFVAEWRWFEGRVDSPWYNSARLFRQSKHGDWGSVINKICSEIKVKLSK